MGSPFISTAPRSPARVDVVPRPPRLVVGGHCCRGRFDGGLRPAAALVDARRRRKCGPGADGGDHRGRQRPVDLAAGRPAADEVGPFTGCYAGAQVIRVESLWKILTFTVTGLLLHLALFVAI